MTTNRRAAKLWKSRAQIALGNRRRDFHFPTAATATIPLTIVITFCKINSQRRFAPRTDHINPGTLITISPESRSPSSESARS